MNTYFDTRGSYRRTADSVDRRVNYVAIYRIIDRLGIGCKDSVTVAKELHPRWSGMLGCDGKVIKVHGDEWVTLIAADIWTQDIVDWRFTRR